MHAYAYGINIEYLGPIAVRKVLKAAIRPCFKNRTQLYRYTVVGHTVEVGSSQNPDEPIHQ